MSTVKKINYKTLATKIINTIEQIVDEKDFQRSLALHYSDSLNEAITVYKLYVREVLNTEAAEALNIRTILVSAFREIEEMNKGEAIEYLSDILKKEINSLKRRERYIREKAQDEGKEYISKIVNFNDIDETKEILESNNKVEKIKINTPEVKLDNIKRSDEFNIYEQLNNQKPITFGKKDLETIDNNTTNDIEFKTTIVTPSKQIKPDSPGTLPSVPEYIEEELYTYPDEVIATTGMDYNLNYKKDKTLVIYKLIITGNKKLNNIYPFTPTITSNSVQKMFYKEKAIGSVTEEIYKYCWQMHLIIVTNENIETTITKLKNYNILNGANFNFKVIYNVRPNDNIFIIKL